MRVHERCNTRDSHLHLWARRSQFSEEKRLVNTQFSSRSQENEERLVSWGSAWFTNLCLIRGSYSWSQWWCSHLWSSSIDKNVDDHLHLDNDHHLRWSSSLAMIILTIIIIDEDDLTSQLRRRTANVRSEVSQISKCPNIKVILTYWEPSREVSELRYKSLLFDSSRWSYCTYICEGIFKI